jgi:hypothetical protein
MPLTTRFSPCYTKGNNTAGKYLYLNARNMMGAYYTNNSYISLQIYLFIYLFLILACNRKVMAEATYSNYKVGSLAVTPGPHRDTPRSGRSVRGCSPPLLSLCMFHLASSVPGALLARRPPRRVVLHFLLPSPPVFSSFSRLCFLHSSYQYIRE